MKFICCFFLIGLLSFVDNEIPEVLLNDKIIIINDTGDWLSGVVAKDDDVLVIKTAWKIEKIQLEYEFSQKGFASCSSENGLSVSYSNSGKHAKFALFSNCPNLASARNKRMRTVWIHIYHNGGKQFVGKLRYNVSG